MIDYIQYFLDVYKKRYKVSDDDVDADLIYDIDASDLEDTRPEYSCVSIATQDLDIEILFDKSGVPKEVRLDFYKHRVFNNTITFKRYRNRNFIWEEDQSRIDRMEVIHYTLWGKIKHFFKKSN